MFVPLSRSKFESLVSPLVSRTVDPCKRALADAGVKASEVDEVILVGGMTRMPCIVETVKQIFSREPSGLRVLNDTRTHPHRFSCGCSPHPHRFSCGCSPHPQCAGLDLSVRRVLIERN